jgi:hypothetical protein
MTMRRDVRGEGPTSTQEPKHEGATPGKRTLVEGIFGGRHGAEEAEKGGTDVKARGAPDKQGALDAEPGQTAAASAEPGHAQALVASTEPGHAQGVATNTQTGGAPAAQSVAPATGPVSKQERVVPRIELGGSAVSSSVISSHAVDAANETKQQRVAPIGSPTFNAAAGSNDCTPGTVSGASVTWTVAESPTTWGVNISGFTTTGVINVAPWPSKPTDMVTPNTANAVDGGNITDAAGHNNWKFAVKEMEEYHQISGGRSSYWHSYEASKAHEWAHWNTDWMITCIGALWPVANTDLDAITIPKADAANAAAAKPLLQAKIDARMATLDAALTAKWIPIPDTPGVAGSTGYIAGQAVLNPLIAAVKAYAAKKKWP